jgi:4-amino-4-deoxy-L-arabinose transferase-like glycosyltransferase
MRPVPLGRLRPAVVADSRLVYVGGSPPASPNDARPMPRPMSRLDAAYRVTERLWWGVSVRGIVILVAVLTLVRLWAADHAGLLFDEPYYWLWSQHLAAGYYDHPPMVAFWIRLGTLLLGDSVLGIRIVFLINVIAVSMATYAMGRVLFDRRTAEHAALWTNTLPLIGIAGMLATPDGPSVLFWTLTVLAYALVVKTGRGVWWLAVGILAGLGAASKYTNLFLGPGIVLSLLLDPRLRRWLISPWLWAGGLLAALAFLPVIMWNAAHDWVSFRFQFGRVAETAFNPLDLVTLILTQPLIFNPLAAVFVVLAAWRTLKPGTPHRRELSVLFATSLPAIFFILFQATHGAVLEHWLAPVFPSLMLAAVAVAETIPDDARYLRRIRTDVVPVALVAMVVVFAYVTTPADRYFPGKDPIDSMRGWPEFANGIEALREKAGAAWIATAQYETTSELSFELRGRATVIPVTERPRYSFEPAPDPVLLARPALLVVRAVTDLAPFRACFASLTEVGALSRTGAVSTIDRLVAYRAEGAKSDLLERGCDQP